MREAMPKEVLVLLMMSKTVMNKISDLRSVSQIDLDRELFSD